MMVVIRFVELKLVLSVHRQTKQEEIVQQFVEILWFWAHRNVTMGD